MKKKLLIGTILPALAAAAVIGSGFALWVFNDLHVEANQSNNLSKDVTQLVRVGTITKADDFKIVFDQTPEGRKANNTLKDHVIGTNSVEAKGIYLDFGANANVNKVAKYDAPAADYAIDETKGIKFNFTTTIKLSEDLAKYVDIKYNTADFKVSNSTYTYVLANNVREFNWENVKLSYKEGMEPSNEDSYKTFREIVMNGNNKIVVDYSVDITSIN